MRLRRRHLLGLGAGLLLPRQAAAQPPAGRIHALTVGINRYRTAPLSGCVHDAQLLAEAFTPIAASVTTLLDADATRQGFLAGWKAVAERCDAGDWLVLTYSGHGAQRPEPPPQKEADGKDEFLVFRDFHDREAPGEILLDDELEVLLAEQARRGVQLLYVADCCHSAGTTRSLDPRASGIVFRTLSGQFDVDALMAATERMAAPPPPPPEALEPVLFLSAGTEAELIPEITWQGRKHGALSVAFAAALRGAADRNRDGVTTQGELYAHILRVCRGLAESRQHPDMVPRARIAQPLFRMAQPAAGAAAAPPLASVATLDPPLRLRILNASPAQAERSLRGLTHALRASAAGEAELTWDARSGEIISQLGDVLGAGIAADRLPGPLGRVRVQRRLAALTAASGLDLRLVLAADVADPLAHDGIHRAGTELRLELSGLRLPHFVLFNIAGTGAVQPMHPPETAPQQERIDPAKPPDLGSFPVQSPFGTDLVVGVAASTSLRPLVDRLDALARREAQGEPPRPLEALAALEAVLATAPDWQIGIQSIVTAA